MHGERLARLKSQGGGLSANFLVRSTPPQTGAIRQAIIARDSREACMTSGPTDGVTALRGTVVTCRDDPFLTDPAKAFVTETDGAVICRNGVIEAVGPAGPLLASVPPDKRHGLSGLPDRARLHRHACALRADRDRRLPRQAAARLARALRVSGRDRVPRSRARGRDGVGLLRRTAAQRHHHGAGVLRGLSAVGRRAVRRGRAARHAHRRRQGADGPQRAGGAARHRAARLRRVEGPDRALAWPRPQPLRDHAALRRHQHAGAARCRGRAVARAPGRAGAHAYRGEPPRDRMDRAAVSRSARTISTSTITTG